MRNFLLIIIFLLSAGYSFGQQLLLLDKVNLQPIGFASIICERPEFNALTDPDGHIFLDDLKGAPDYTLEIRSVGYRTSIWTKAQLIAVNYRVLLSPASFSLKEVVISASRFEEKRSDVPGQITLMRSAELQFQNPATTADALIQSGQVFVQKSQLGGGSPVLRGFEANKISLVIDGVRMNNAIYRGGHLQNVITLDHSILDKTEIVFGPGSVMYGSDALGGVIHYYTRQPLLSYSDSMVYTKVQAYSRYASAAEEVSLHADVNIGWKKVALLTSITGSEFGDLRQGGKRNPFYGDWGKRTFYADRIDDKDSMLINDNVNIQKGSGYSQVDFLQKLLYKPSEKTEHLVNVQVSHSSDVPRYDRLSLLSGSLPRFAEWYYGSQNRLLTSYSFRNSRDLRLSDDFRIIAAFQDIDESRHDRRFNNTTLNNRLENVRVYSLNADAEKKVGEHELRFGAEFIHNDVQSTAFSENIITKTRGNLDTRYPDGGSTMSSAAAFLTHHWEISPKIILSDGIRFNTVQLKSEFTDTTFFNFPFTSIQQDNVALNGHLGLVFQPGLGWRFSTKLANGFRTPNVDDLAKIFESVPGEVILPNNKLKPEQIYSLEVSASKNFHEAARIEAGVYQAWYRDAITTSYSSYQGSDSIFYGGQMSRVKTSTNAGKAYLRGAYVSFEADVNEFVSIVSQLNYSYGRIETDTTDYPLDHIPPVYGKTSLVLNVNKFRGEFYALYNGWKHLEDYKIAGGSEDNLNSATAFGTPAWLTLNVRTAYQLDKRFRLEVNLENILDQNYRVFASGISAPGRNLIVALRVKL